MQRAPLGTRSYWDGRVKKFEETIAADLLTLNAVPANLPYEPHYWFDHSKYVLRLILLRYSRGDPVDVLSQNFHLLLEGWERSNEWIEQISQTGGDEPRRGWTFDLNNLNHYNWCFWLIGLALILDIPGDEWHRLVALVDGAGHDALLDRVVAIRQADRLIGTAVLHPKPYARLLKVLDAPKIVQAELLRDFVNHWYPELARIGREELWWYVYGDPIKHPLNMGSYFGRWCIEAAVVAKVFGINDSLCLGLEYYPGDLLRPNGPSTHAGDASAAKTGVFRKFLNGFIKT